MLGEAQEKDDELEKVIDQRWAETSAELVDVSLSDDCQDAGADIFCLYHEIKDNLARQYGKAKEGSHHP